MFCKCPDCRTIFKVTRTQLTIRDGFVRCGKCSAVFNGKQSLFEQLPKSRGNLSPQDSATPAARHGTPSEKHQQTGGAADRAPIFDAIRSSSRIDTKTGDVEIPTVTERLPWSRPIQRTRPIFWVLGIFMLVAVFIGQIMHYYRSELAQYAELRPLVSEYCRLFECDVEPKRRVGLIELTQTAISPHPRYDNILRIRASMVNRAAFGQPYPLMEVTLTDNAGKVIARRSFSHSQYLERSIPAQDMLPPHVIVKTLLDVTSPDTSAVGYEIQLVVP